MLGWSLKFHPLLASLSEDPKHHESWMQIFNQRTEEWAETERLLMFDHLNLCTINQSAVCPVLPLEDCLSIKSI